MKNGSIERADATDAALLPQNAVPECISPFADGGDRTQPGDNCTSLPVFHRVSKCDFMQRKVLFAMWWIKKVPMIGSATGARADRRKFKSCVISTSTPAGVCWKVQTTCIP